MFSVNILPAKISQPAEKWTGPLAPMDSYLPVEAGQFGLVAARRF